MGPWGEETRNFVSQLARRIQEVSEEKRATEFLRRRISLEIQRENATCVRGISVVKNSLGEITLAIRP